jgi:plasmid rolling circle replication initiator protein Rep
MAKEARETLKDRSRTGRERPWRTHKRTSRAIAASLWRIYQEHPKKNAWAKKRSDRIQQCSNYLQFGDYANTETGEVTRRLVAAQFCRDRLCPMCAWRKSLVMFSQISQIMDWVSEREKVVPIFLTLTVKNCAGDDLEQTVDLLLKSWSRMMTSRGRRKPWQVSRGWFRALEITYNAKTDEWHPHLHAIVLVEPDYFTDEGKYIDHDAWIAEWKWALGVDYDPSVDVRTVKGDRAKAVAEVAKYTVKPGEWLDLDDAEGTDRRVALLAQVLKGRRLTALGGIMKEAKAALKLEDVEQADLVLTDAEKAETRGEVLVALIRFEWQIGPTNYICTEVQQVEPPQRE